jgi:hypothetical protein
MPLNEFWFRPKERQFVEKIDSLAHPLLHAPEPGTVPSTPVGIEFHS